MPRRSLPRPLFVSAEIGLIGNDIVAVMFNQPVMASDFAAGVIIKVNGDEATIESTERQSNHTVVYYTLTDPASEGDPVTWEYSGGNIAAEDDGLMMGVVSMRIVINNITEESDPIGDALRADAKAYWKMDETSGTRADSTGNNHNASVHGAGVASAAGKVGNAMFSNAIDRYLGVADHADLQVPGAQSFSISFWLYIDVMPGDESTTILIAKQGFGQDTAYEIDIEAQVVTFYIAGTDLSYPFVSSDVLSVGQWYGVEAEFESGVGLTLRIDNGSPIFQAYTLDNIGLSAGSDDVEIGHSFIDGQFRQDEMGFWKRVKSSDERTHLYNAGAGRSLYP